MPISSEAESGPRPPPRYGEYVTECSKLFSNSIDHTLDQPSAMVTALAILNRIRLTASPPVMEAAEASLYAIVQDYFRDKMTLAQMNAHLRDGTKKFPDPLANFSATCRIELKEIHRVRRDLVITLPYLVWVTFAVVLNITLWRIIR